MLRSGRSRKLGSSCHRPRHIDRSSWDRARPSFRTRCSGRHRSSRSRSHTPARSYQSYNACFRDRCCKMCRSSRSARPCSGPIHNRSLSRGRPRPAPDLPPRSSSRARHPLGPRPLGAPRPRCAHMRSTRRAPRQAGGLESAYSTRNEHRTKSRQPRVTRTRACGIPGARSRTCQPAHHRSRRYPPCGVARRASSSCPRARPAD